MAMMTSSQGQQLQWQQQQRCLHIKVDNTITTRVTMPA
jgi:hypothetical protein